MERDGVAEKLMPEAVAAKLGIAVCPECRSECGKVVTVNSKNWLYERIQWKPCGTCAPHGGFGFVADEAAAAKKERRDVGSGCDSQD